MFQSEKLIEIINSDNTLFKNKALKRLLALEKLNSALTPVVSEEVCLHYASNFYYSQYTPYCCAYAGYRAGFFGVGVSDYASLRGYKDFRQASQILNMPYTYGYHLECQGLFGEERSVAYGYGVSYEQSTCLDKELEKYRQIKIDLAYNYIQKINSRLNKYNIKITKKEVIKNSKFKKSGLITEKNVFRVLAEKLLGVFGKGESLVEFLTSNLKVDSNLEDLIFLKEVENKFIQDDLTKILYNNRKIFKVKENFPTAKEIVRLNEKYGVITSYKLKPKKYSLTELEKICDTLTSLGFNAVTFDDRKLTNEKLDEVINLFISKNLLPISLYRMGMPRQTGRHSAPPKILFETSLAVIGNAKSTAYNIEDGMFTKTTIERCSDLKTRIELFSNIGKR